MKKISLILFYLFILNINLTLADWLSGIGGYLGYKQEENQRDKEIYEQKIPYEVSTTDENFLKEAAKLTDLALSELDSCQHRVILKLKSYCDKLNDDQLAKLAVHLLNCQSWVEGRPIYPCTDEMSIKDCTITMDSDTWTSYHLMSNRARAVCYSVRQSQFRGLAEHTINRLMDAARSQLKNLGELSSTQQSLKHLTEKTYLTVRDGHRDLLEQQDKLKKAQFYGQLTIEDNIKRLADEKKLIKETHDNLVIMTKNIHRKLEDTLEQLQDQSSESKINHKELMNDLLVIQETSNVIFERIEQSSSLLIQQNEDFNRQYKSTLQSLQEMNRTVNELVSHIRATWLSLEERLTWIVAALGGTDIAIDRIYLIFWHFMFMLMAMLICAFLAARPSTRLVVTLLPSFNLTVALLGEYQYLDLVPLFGIVGIFITTQTLILWASAIKHKVICAVARKNRTPTKDSIPSKTIISEVSKSNHYTTSSTTFNEDDYEDENTDTFQDFNFTPPESRNGHYFPRSASRSRSRTPLLLSSSLKIGCRARTRMGTPCKLAPLPERDFCYRHQSGSSVAG